MTVRLADSTGQEFGQGAVGMVYFHSTMARPQPGDSEANGDSTPGGWKYLKVCWLS